MVMSMQKKYWWEGRRKLYSYNVCVCLKLLHNNRRQLDDCRFRIQFSYVVNNNDGVWGGWNNFINLSIN